MMRTKRGGRQAGIFPALIALVVGFIAGCGGGGGGTDPTPTPGASRGPLRLTVNWPAQSRAVSAPASARSLIVAISDASGAAVAQERFPRSGPTAHADNYATEAKLTPGTYRVALTCRAETDGGGATVGGANVTVSADGNGADLGTFSMESRIARVEIAPGQTVTIGTPAELAFAAYDAQNNILLLNRAAAFFQSAPADILTITPDQWAAGGNPGAATVTASVDGVVSPAVAVKVTSAAQVNVQPPYALVMATQSLTLTATVAALPTGATGEVTWAVAESDGGTVTAAGLYTAPAIPGTYHVLARSVYDPDKTAQAAIVVTPFNGANVPIDFGDRGDLPIIVQ